MARVRGLGELALGEGLRRLERGQPEARHAQRMMRNPQYWPKSVFRELPPVVSRGLHQTPPSLAVYAQRAFRLPKVALQHHCRSIVERMRQRRISVDPLQSVILERQRREERRSGREGMHGRAEVMQKSRQRERKRARRAARLGLRFEDLHAHPRLRKHNGRGQAVRTRSNHAGAAHRFILLPATLLQSCGSSWGHSTTAKLPSAVIVSSGA